MANDGGNFRFLGKAVGDSGVLILRGGAGGLIFGQWRWWLSHPEILSV